VDKKKYIEELRVLGEEVQRLEEKNCPTNPSKWSYYKSQAKQKFDVYPSAYANGWASKQYKAAGGGWKQCAGESVNEKMITPQRGHNYYQLYRDTPIKYVSGHSGIGLKVPGVLLHNEYDTIKGKKGAYIIDYFGAHFYVDMKNKFASRIAHPDNREQNKDLRKNMGRTALAPEHKDWKKYMNESVNEEFQSKDRDFEKVYAIFDKKDYFNAKGLAKTQIGNFERALQRNDKGAQQILDKFKGDMEKSKEYIIQVISDQKKQQAFEDYKKFKKAVENILYRPNGNEEYASADFIKSRVHNNSQKYTIALYSSIRNKKFTNYKDIHADVDSLMTESVNEGKKRFRQQDGIGKAKYTISYHDGKEKHKDGSDFFGIQIFKNKKDLETFRKSLLSKGYVEESVNEAASRTAMEIGGLTGMNKDAIQKFVDDNKLDIEKVYQYVKNGKLPERMALVSAIAGKPGNAVQSKLIKKFK
jgi:hypothetical protein